MSIERIFCALLTASLLAACASTKPVSAPEPASTPAPAQSAAAEEIFHEALQWSRNSAEHRAVYEQIFTVATRHLEELAAGHETGSWAVSIDADETLIDNSTYEVEISQRGETFDQQTWNEWVHREEAPATPGAVTFTAKVKSMGGIVAVVTNRRTHQCAATADNLRKDGIVFDVVLCRLDDGEKEPRWEALSQGTTAQWPDAQFSGKNDYGPLTILMWLGDNIGDFPDHDQETRHREGPMYEYGDKFFILPNPLYGSWESNPKQ